MIQNSDGDPFPKKKKGPKKGTKQCRDPAIFLQRLEEKALEHGGRLEEGQAYINTLTKLWFIDADGTRFQAIPNQILAGRWRMRFDPAERMEALRSIAESHGAKLVEGQAYKSAHSKLLFEDHLGVKFLASPNAVIRGVWAGSSPIKTLSRQEGDARRMERLRGIPHQQGLEILPWQTLAHPRKKLLMRGSDGLLYEATPQALERGIPKLAKRSIDPNPPGAGDSAILCQPEDPHFPRSASSTDPADRLARIASLAASRNWTLADGQAYSSPSAPLVFLDSKGREFSVPPSILHRKRKSPGELEDEKSGKAAQRKQAFQERRREREKAKAFAALANREAVAIRRLAELREIAKSRGGDLAEGQRYVNGTTPLWFVDASGFRFQAKPMAIKSGGWSPNEGLVGETLCRQAFAHFFGKEFPSAWGVVRRPNGRSLQLDGYCEPLSVAFEYQGYLHARDEALKIRDAEKRAGCAKKGILLIEVEEFSLPKLSSAIETTDPPFRARIGRCQSWLPLSGFGRTGPKSTDAALRTSLWRKPSLPDTLAAVFAMERCIGQPQRKWLFSIPKATFFA